jgi:hypothetical protein
MACRAAGSVPGGQGGTMPQRRARRERGRTGDVRAEAGADGHVGADVPHLDRVVPSRGYQRVLVLRAAPPRRSASERGAAPPAAQAQPAAAPPAGKRGAAPLRERASRGPLSMLLHDPSPPCSTPPCSISAMPSAKHPLCSPFRWPAHRAARSRRGRHTAPHLNLREKTRFECPALVRPYLPCAARRAPHNQRGALHPRARTQRTHGPHRRPTWPAPPPRLASIATPPLPPQATSAACWPRRKGTARAISPARQPRRASHGAPSLDRRDASHGRGWSHPPVSVDWRVLVASS